MFDWHIGGGVVGRCRTGPIRHF